MQRRLRFLPAAASTPVAQHRGGDAQLPGDLHQRPAAARQQGNRLRLELIRKMTPFLAHSTPSRSSRSLPKVSTNSGEAQAGFGTSWFMGLWRSIGLTLPVSRIRLESNSEFRM